MAPKSNAKAVKAALKVKAALRFKLDATARQRKRTVKRDHNASFKRDSFVVLRALRRRRRRVVASGELGVVRVEWWAYPRQRSCIVASRSRVMAARGMHSNPSATVI